MQRPTLAFFIIFTTLLVFTQASTNIIFPRRRSTEGNKLTLSKRETVNGQYVPDNLLSLGYFTFPDKIIEGLQKAKPNSDDYYAILAAALEIKEDKWIDECHQVSNATAKAAHRNDTASRYAIILRPDEQEIDPKYGYAITAKLACWEYNLKGDINNPVAQYTGQLINQLHLDIASARAYLEQQHKRLPGK